LFDQNISLELSLKLKQISWRKSQTTRNWKLFHIKIWKYAKENKFTIVTFDADFFWFIQF
jgi:predicted nuclease of predicted toxin-antitoxin system